MEDECNIVLQSHPEMVLMSRNPYAWKGFLDCRSASGRSVRIKTKIVVPHYPSVDGATVYFGETLGRLICRNFTKATEEVTRNSRTVTSLLKQLQSLISTRLVGNHFSEIDSTNVTENEALAVVQELRDTLKFESLEGSDVRLLTDNKLSAIELTMNKASVTLSKKTAHNAHWTVVSSDLPRTIEFGPFERNLVNLHAARNKFKLQVQIFEKCWRRLSEIDRHCWVLDPVEPAALTQLYRRIYLTDSLSALIKLHPLNPEDLPDIKFLGCEKEAREREAIVSANAHNWDPEVGMVESLANLLGVTSFPRKKEKQEPGEESDEERRNAQLVTDEECCICFSLESSEERLPNVICNNEKCRRHFHGSCLVQWLQAVTGSYFVFGQIHGSCPHCGESISCSAV